MSFLIQLSFSKMVHSWEVLNLDECLINVVVHRLVLPKCWVRPEFRVFDQDSNQIRVIKFDLHIKFDRFHDFSFCNWQISLWGSWWGSHFSGILHVCIIFPRWRIEFLFDNWCCGWTEDDLPRVSWKTPIWCLKLRESCRRILIEWMNIVVVWSSSNENLALFGVYSQGVRILRCQAFCLVSVVELHLMLL